MYLFCLSYKSATTPATCSRLVRASRLPACTACSSTAFARSYCFCLAFATRFFIVGSTLAIRLRHRVDFLHAQQVRAGLYLLLCLLQVEATHAVLYLVFVAAQRAVHLVQQAGIDIR